MGERVLEVLATAPANALITGIRDALSAAVEKLVKARMNTPHNSQTDKQEAADQARDNAVRALFGYVDACTLRQNTRIRSIAEEVSTHLEKFDRGLYRLGYQAQSAQMGALFDTLDPLGDQLSEMGASKWYSEVKEAEESFLAVFSDKIGEETAKSQLLSTKEAKKEVLSNLIALTQVLNGMEMAGIEDFSDINAQIDTVIGSIEGPARARMSQRRNAEGEEEEGDTQKSL